MDEQWKPIEGFEGYYEISNQGRIRSVDRRCRTHSTEAGRRVKGQLMKPTDNGNGYLVIHLKKNGKRISRYIHRLVAEAFLEMPTGSNVVDHIDYNKKNNAVDNLQWCTQKENICRSRARMRKQHKTNPPSGYKYISIKGGRYRVNIKKAKVYKTFLSLEEAIEYRNEVCNEVGLTA